MKTAQAVAHSNIALVKYWGKRHDADPGLNLPAVGSLSMTLDQLRSVTRVGPGPADRFILDGSPARDDRAAKVFAHLDRVWTHAGGSGTRPPCAVQSENHLPTAAGLASSASGFAALTVAAAAAFEWDADRSALSSLARMGSGSAARSIWGGFVRLDRGVAADGHDCVARPLCGPDHFDVRLLVVHTASGEKPLGSTEGMQRSRLTSPYYPAWVAGNDADLDAAQQALLARDFDALGAITEHSCFKMHACMWATRPPIVYWNATTMAVFHALWAARDAGLVGYATSDAGPHVKVLCRTADAEALAQRLGKVPGVEQLAIVRPGPDAAVMEYEP